MKEQNWTKKRPTWAQLVKAEPDLKSLLDEARAVSSEDNPHFCANRVWYTRGGLKSDIVALVGWMRKEGPVILRTNMAYDVAYHKVYDALPACRDCGCW